MQFIVVKWYNIIKISKRVKDYFKLKGKKKLGVNFNFFFVSIMLKEFFFSVGEVLIVMKRFRIRDFIVELY